MADFTITNTKKYNKSEVKSGTIDGVEYKVRYIGAGDQLTFLEGNRKLKKLKTMMELAESDEEKEEIHDKLTDLTLDLESIIIDLFDDGTEDRKNSKKLIRGIGIDGAMELINEIFSKKGD